MELAALLAIADQILSGKDQADQAVDLLEHYSNGLDDFLQQFESKGLEESSQIRREEILELAEKHRQIIEYAERFKAVTGDQIKSLKRRGEGLIAYTDTLPRKIAGLLSPKKG